MEEGQSSRQDDCVALIEIDTDHLAMWNTESADQRQKSNKFQFHLRSNSYIQFAIP